MKARRKQKEEERIHYIKVGGEGGTKDLYSTTKYMNLFKKRKEEKRSKRRITHTQTDCDCG